MRRPLPIHSRDLIQADELRSRDLPVQVDLHEQGARSLVQIHQHQGDEDVLDGVLGLPVSLLPLGDGQGELFSTLTVV